MPYPNFHSARIKRPGDFVRIVVLKTLPNGVMIYGGPLKSNPTGDTTAQAYRFPKSKFTVAEAKAWLKEHNISYILFEPAGPSASSNILADNNYNCECIKCGYRLTSDKHCADLKCPECGGQMRRRERPGPGQTQSALPFYGVASAGCEALAVSSVKEKDGEDPIQHFKKDVLPVGLYTHPLLGWKLDITEERLSHFLAAYRQMQTNGVDVEIPLDHSRSAADNLGYAIDAMIERNPDNENKLTLYYILEIRGTDAIDIVKRNKNVSVAIDREYKDGEGNAYGEAIVHVSIVQQPVVPGQSDFEPVGIAAGRGSEKIPVFTLSNLEGDKDMDEKMLKELKEILGAGDDLTAENALSRIGERVKQQDEKIEDLTKKLTDKAAAKGKITDDKTKTASIEMSPNLAEQIADRAEKNLDELVKEGRILPAVCDKLKASLIGERGKRNVAMLSLRGENAETPSIADEVYDALKENDPVKLGEQTKRQTTLLSRDNPDDTDEVKPDEESGKQMLSGAGVQPKEEKKS